MMINLPILDFICMSITLLALVMIPRSYKWWLLYTFSALCYLYVRIKSGLISSAILEIVASIVGIYNYTKLKHKKSNKINVKTPVLFL